MAFHALKILHNVEMCIANQPHTRINPAQWDELLMQIMDLKLLDWTTVLPTLVLIGQYLVPRILSFAQNKLWEIQC